MSISTLSWFVELASTDPTAPNRAVDLSLELRLAINEAQNPKLNPKSTKRKISRIFERHLQSLIVINNWLSSTSMKVRIDATNNQQIKSSYKESKTAIVEIISGVPVARAWGIGKKRGVSTGFSKTLEASALVGYLIKEEQFNISKNAAIEMAANIFELNPDEIRRYNALSTVDVESEAAIAFSAIARNNKIKISDRHFDIEVLRDRAIK